MKQLFPLGMFGSVIWCGKEKNFFREKLFFFLFCNERKQWRELNEKNGKEKLLTKCRKFFSKQKAWGKRKWNEKDKSYFDISYFHSLKIYPHSF